MEVILLKVVEKLGKKGDLVNVRDGYGRNFLIPRTLAVPATAENRVRAETDKKLEAGRKSRKREEASKLAEQLTSLELRLEAAVGEKNKLFGAVTTQDLADALAQKGISVDKKQFKLSEPLRSLGKHTVTVELAPEVKAALQVEIVKKS